MSIEKGMPELLCYWSRCFVVLRTGRSLEQDGMPGMNGLCLALAYDQRKNTGQMNIIYISIASGFEQFVFANYYPPLANSFDLTRTYDYMHGCLCKKKNK